MTNFQENLAAFHRKIGLKIHLGIRCVNILKIFSIFASTQIFQLSINKAINILPSTHVKCAIK